MATLPYPDEAAIEAAMYRRLGREHGITDITCPKCLHHALLEREPALELPLSFGFTVGPHSFDWPKERMDQAARRTIPTWLPWLDVERLLESGGHDPAHVDHLPPGRAGAAGLPDAGAPP